MRSIDRDVSMWFMTVFQYAVVQCSVNSRAIACSVYVVMTSISSSSSSELLISCSSSMDFKICLEPPCQSPFPTFAAAFQ